MDSERISTVLYVESMMDVIMLPTHNTPFWHVPDRMRNNDVFVVHLYEGGHVLMH